MTEGGKLANALVFAVRNEKPTHGNNSTRAKAARYVEDACQSVIDAIDKRKPCTRLTIKGYVTCEECGHKTPYRYDKTCPACDGRLGQGGSTSSAVSANTALDNEGVCSEIHTPAEEPLCRGDAIDGKTCTRVWRNGHDECSRCHATLPRINHFCGYCGARIVEPTINSIATDSSLIVDEVER